MRLFSKRGFSFGRGSLLIKKWGRKTKMSMENRFFEILMYRVQIEENLKGKEHKRLNEATIKMQVRRSDGQLVFVHKVADGEGVGPVDALDKVLRKALIDFYPQVANVRLMDYEVHKKNGDIGTESLVEVIITSTDGQNQWRTSGVSVNVIKASLLALAKSLEEEISRLLVTV